MDGTVSRRTMVHRESIFRVHIKPTNGTQRVSSLTDKDFQRLYRTKVYEGFAAGTLECIHALLKRLGMPFAANTLATAHYPM
jgi:hypothetical protein